MDSGVDRRGAALGRGLRYLLPLGFLGVFFFYPLAAVVVESFAPGGQLNLAPIASLWREPYFGRALWFTTWQAALSTSITLALGMPAAFVFARYRFPGKTLLRALTTIPFVLPAMVVASAFTALLGPRGWLNSLLMDWFDMTRAPIRLQQTIWLVLLAHAFYNTAIVIRIVGGFWSNLDTRLSEAARIGWEPAARFPRDHAAAAAAGRGRGRAADLPLLLHELRGSPDPWRAALCHAGGGDLPPGGGNVSPARGSGDRAGADRTDVRGHGRVHPRTGARLAAPEPASGRRDRGSAHHAGKQDLRGPHRHRPAPVSRGAADRTGPACACAR